jgi:hypothetical protein
LKSKSAKWWFCYCNYLLVCKLMDVLQKWKNGAHLPFCMIQKSVHLTFMNVLVVRTPEPKPLKDS